MVVSFPFPNIHHQVQIVMLFRPPWDICHVSSLLGEHYPHKGFHLFRVQFETKRLVDNTLTESLISRLTLHFCLLFREKQFNHDFVKRRGQLRWNLIEQRSRCPSLNAAAAACQKLQTQRPFLNSRLQRQEFYCQSPFPDGAAAKHDCVLPNCQQLHYSSPDLMDLMHFIHQFDSVLVI